MCLIYLIISVAILISAAVSDVRTREVDDRHWIVLTAIGIMVQATFATESLIHMMAGILTDVLLAMYMFYDKTEGIVGIITLAIAFLIAMISWMLDASNPIACRNLVTCLMFMMLLGMYRLELIRGGADVKALMCMAICFPTYIETYGLPVVWHTVPPTSYLFNPPLMILLVALIVTMLYSVYTAAMNIHNRDWHRSMLSGYWMPINKARKSFVWPIVDLENDRIVRTDSYDDSGEIYDRLEENGFERVLVTPMIPFILPITIGFVFTMFLGNPLQLII